jgi:hypothetical protein
MWQSTYLGIDTRMQAAGGVKPPELMVTAARGIRFGIMALCFGGVALAAMRQNRQSRRDGAGQRPFKR